MQQPHGLPKGPTTPETLVGILAIAGAYHFAKFIPNDGISTLVFIVTMIAIIMHTLTIRHYD